MLITSYAGEDEVYEKMLFHSLHSWKVFLLCACYNRKHLLLLLNVLIIRCWSPHMLDNVVFPCKCFSTIFTLERSFSSVHSKNTEIYNSQQYLNHLNHLMWSTRFPFLENVFSQWSHLKHFSAAGILKRKKYITLTFKKYLNYQGNPLHIKN